MPGARPASLGDNQSEAARAMASDGAAALSSGCDLNRMRHRIAGCVVVLHLRARYVSKAAILTLSGHTVPVENRSPA